MRPSRIRVGPRIHVELNVLKTEFFRSDGSASADSARLPIRRDEADGLGVRLRGAALIANRQFDADVHGLGRLRVRGAPVPALSRAPRPDGRARQLPSLLLFLRLSAGLRGRLRVPGPPTTGSVLRATIQSTRTSQSPTSVRRSMSLTSCRRGRRHQRFDVQGLDFKRRVDVERRKRRRTGVERGDADRTRRSSAGIDAMGGVDRARGRLSRAGAGQRSRLARAERAITAVAACVTGDSNLDGKFTGSPSRPAEIRREQNAGRRGERPRRHARPATSIGRAEGSSANCTNLFR